jgi:hypothetical protein
MRTLDRAIPRLGTGDLHDFDFLAGKWTVHNRRLAERGVGCTTWDEFPAETHVSLHMGSVVNVEEIVFPTKGWAGMTVRAFALATRQWSIYWINSQAGVLFPPVVGGFDGDRGEFYGTDEDGGHPVNVQFCWTRLGPDRARWEQAFAREGAAWETNWTMDFTRAR